MTEQRTDAAPDERPAWLTEDCPAWCDYRDNPAPGFRHRDRDQYAERLHIGERTAVTLTSNDAPSLPLAGGGLEVFDEPTAAEIYLVQHYREIEPRIHLGEDDLPGMHLTLVEAERLARRLVEQVAIARGEV